MHIVDCTYEAHGAAILDIFNEAILNSTALYEYKPRTAEDLLAWFGTKAAGNYPVLGALDAGGTLLGFGSYGSFRPRAAYKYSVEHSVYVHVQQRRRGLGTLLLKELIETAKRQQYHVLVGAIDIANASSIALHERLGFSHAGTVRQAGFKFGRWLDLGLYQLVLETPATPVDG